MFATPSLGLRSCYISVGSYLKSASRSHCFLSANGCYNVGEILRFLRLKDSYRGLLTAM